MYNVQATGRAKAWLCVAFALRVPVRRLPRPSLSVHVKNLGSGGRKCRRGERRKWSLQICLVLVKESNEELLKSLYQRGTQVLLCSNRLRAVSFFRSPSCEARETRKWPRVWLKARDGRGTGGAFFLLGCRSMLASRALPCIKSDEKERLLAVYCSHKKAATTRQALKIPLSFLFDIFTFSTLRILTLAEFVCTGIKISKEFAVA